MSALPAHVVPPPPEAQPSPVRPGLMARLLRLHIRDVAVLGAFIAIFTMALKPVVDNDVFWHLATGRYMWATGRVPHTDPFSWTAFGRAWIAHEWLTELWLYPLYTHGGYAALMLVFAAVIAAAFAFAYATARELGASRPFAVGITLLAAVASSHTWGVRPQMLSMLLMALTLWLLTRYATNPSRRLWMLPPLMLLWANLHGGFIFGLGLIGLVAFGCTCEAWWERRARNNDDGYADTFIAMDRTAPSKVPRMSVSSTNTSPLHLWRVLAACVAACAINPNGVKGLIYPFTYLGNNASTRYIAEWVSPDFHQLQYQFFEALLLALIAGMALSARRPRATEVLLAVAFTYLALDSVRNINLFAVIVAPLVAVYLSFAWRALRGTPHPRPLSRRGRGGKDASPRPTEGGSTHPTWSGARGRVTPAKGMLNLALVVVVALSALWISAPGLTYAHNATEQARRFPAGAVAYLRAHQPTGRLLNSYDWGGYLIWNLYPRVRVYVDGRPDMYGDRFMDAFVRTWQAKPGWQATLKRQDVRLVLVEPDSGLGHALAGTRGWRVAYHDNMAVLYERAA